MTDWCKFSQKNRIWHFKQIVSFLRDSLHDIRQMGKANESLNSLVSLTIGLIYLKLWLYVQLSLQPSHQLWCQSWWLSWMRIRLVIRRLHVQPPLGWQHSFIEINHEIFSTVILSLPLIQEMQLSVSGERMCTILVWGLSLPSKSVVR